MRALRKSLAVYLGIFAALGCSDPGQSQEKSRSTIATQAAVASDQDWSSDGDAYGLSFRRFGWDLMSRVRPEVASARYSVEIISADKVPLFCHAMDRTVPKATHPEQHELTEQIKTLAAGYVVGATQNDRVGGSKILSSRIQMAGDVAVLRVQTETLDQARPLLRQELVQFGLAEDHAFRYVQIECFVGNGAPPARWAEIGQVLDTLQIKGAPVQ